MVSFRAAAAVFAFAGAVAAQSHAAGDYLWPYPAQVTDKKALISAHGFTLADNSQNNENVVAAFGRLQASARSRFSASKAKSSLTVTVSIANDNGFAAKDLVGADESYTLDVSSSGVNVKANTQVGAIYALQTLSQLVTSSGQVVAATVNDAPAYPYRGFMLDTARNFFPVADIKRIIDGLAYSKINVFHWHIYDSQSFPIDWPSYPQLLNAAYKDANGKPKVYNEQDVRDIVQYAFQRNIRVLPEFEAIGHNAVFAAADPSFVVGLNHAPWDGRNGDANNASNGVVWWGTQWCNQPPCGQIDLTNQAAINFFNQLVAEVGAWFEDPVLNFGHDEFNYRVYGTTPDSWDSVDVNGIYQLMAQAEPKLLQVAQTNNKHYGAWDDIVTDFNVQNIIPKDTYIWNWQGDNSAIQNFADQGFTNIIATTSNAYYLDCSPSAHWCSDDFERSVPATSYNLTGYATFAGQWHNWTRIYTYDATTGLTASAKKALIGGSVALWSETIKRHNLDRYVFPRTSAFAERYWSGSAAPAYDAVKTAARLDRFRTTLVNELQIAAADLSYLGNQEGTVFRPEWCDANLATPGQKTHECCFPGEPLTGHNGSPIDTTVGYHFPSNDNTDYCKIASTYKTNSYTHAVPQAIPYPY
ncbi:glycoside hydrolase superfamily [Polychytrium aggregatum]|uniref:glycoside hydrolase superfamily n=1 Tax=Polychytrium aggregatum TaxID=110093 RepID=UPI0022FF14C6|nr:glycoside hydrolase superfamily [Polychytrium aggregatum]KAI9202653.1 glycoside hydrolase superfamily [Polychytrium aggregatum]